MADDSGRTAVRRAVDGTVLETLRVPARAAQLDLEPHPEGGWYRRTWASPAAVDLGRGRRPAATAVLFLLPPGESSIWHVVASDELWLWHGPGPVTLQLGGAGDVPDAAVEVVLDAEHVQHRVPAGVWQRTVPAGTECLVTCVVSPGFDFADFRTQ